MAAFGATGFVAALLTYRAAIASARYYGALLLIIATYRPVQELQKLGAKTPWWRRIIEVGAAPPQPADRRIRLAPLLLKLLEPGQSVLPHVKPELHMLGVISPFGTTEPVVNAGLGVGLGH